MITNDEKHSILVADQVMVVRYRMLLRGNNFLLMFRIANFLTASFFVLCVIIPDSWCDGPFNPCPPPPNPHGPMTQGEIILAMAPFIWFASSLGLFFRSRLGWLGSLAGIGLATYISGCLLVDVASQVHFSHTADPEITMAWRVSVVRILAPVMMIGAASVPAVICVGLIIGLFNSQRDLRLI